MGITELKSALAANQSARIALLGRASRCQRGSESWNAYRTRIAALRIEAEPLLAAIKAAEAGAETEAEIARVEARDTTMRAEAAIDNRLHDAIVALAGGKRSSR